MNRWSPPPPQWHSLVAESLDSILLETSRSDARSCRSYLFLHPVRVLSVTRLEQIPGLFSQLDEALAGGFHVAGFVGYESGYHFQSLEDLSPIPSELPLAWFGVYREPLVHNHQVSCEERDAAQPLIYESANLLEMHPQYAALTISRDDYCARVERIKDYIMRGDTYQTNFTDFIDVRTPASPAEIYATLSRRQPVPYSAFLNVAGHQILSFSPELFFKLDDGRIVTRPMKGTMARGRDSVEDAEAAERLRNDEKNRAEHVMIVDLLRNDLGRICEMGSIQVEDIFSVEKYSTLFQMTSTVSGTLQPELGYYDIFKSLFPSGSITGAPKIRTMQIIHELEQQPRGVYTGAIGFIAPDRSSIFNVAIRTLVLKDGRVRMGVGGGIVADSLPSDEFRECQLKASFLIRSRPTFQLIETMLWDGGYVFLKMHLDRMESSASYFDFFFDRASVISQLMERSSRFPPGKQYRVRLLLDSTGAVAITNNTYQPEHSTVCVRISSERTSSDDVFLRHKTTYRDQYERLYKEARADGFDDVIFLNEREEVTEGTISNIFIALEGKLLTPLLDSGVLPGIFRRHVLESQVSAEERVLYLRDLERADSIFICNAVRGMRRVQTLSMDSSRGHESVVQ